MSMGGSGGGMRSDINVTPLVDVCLVLLIIFMVVTPMLQRGKDVALPASKTVDEESKSGDPLIVSVTAAGDRYVENDAYRDDTSFQHRIRDGLAENPGRNVLLKADAALEFRTGRAVMELTRQAGAKGVTLAVQEVDE